MLGLISYDLDKMIIQNPLVCQSLFEAYVRKKKPYDDKLAEALDPLNDGCGLDVDNE